ncbi:SWIM zinc finger family protein [Paenibacillus pini]|uniref:SWIM-type domain-containing protein n=1 Tax=Paenibacillus pini JCM 16418 TaxID=1236976 RepID=W7YL51_9BACL|nr:hypothetical protein [Paenibacillus pini]GAF09257.1 hypothetical protein JCM16418_3381 [Paenibacillus pini JCM 16418]
MKPTHTLDDIEWQQLIQTVGEQFNDLTIKRGFQYFKQGRVHQLSTPDAHHVEALVDGSEDYHVKLNTETLSSSRCDCPVPSSCKHMIAVLLEYANLQGQSVHTIVNANANAEFKQIAKPFSSAVTPRSTTLSANKLAEMSAKIKEDAKQLSSMSISAWHDLFNRAIAPLGVNTQNTHYVQNALSSLYALKPDLSPMMELWFGLHVHLFVLRSLIKPQQKQAQPANYHMGYYTQVAADDIHEAVARLFTEQFVLKDEPDPWHRMQETVTYLRKQMLTEPPNITYFSDAYDQLWLNWIHPNLPDKQVLLEELHQLKSAETDFGTSLARLPWMLAQSRMHFYLAQDEQAQMWLRSANKASMISPAILLRYLDALSESKDWDRLQNWLVSIGPMLSSHRKDNMAEYMKHWEIAIAQHPEAEPLMWNTLVQMLPYSKKIYEETLLSHERWHEWMDYQLSIGKEPLELRVSVMQPIEKNAPELLLPFYHQAVERYILLKIRSSYKSAVKLLKRLSKLYKKMKQEERWELF